MVSELRKDLPPLPEKMRDLPVVRGFPVPWFVTWLRDGQEVEPGEGEPEFRVMSERRLVEAVTSQKCWVCGKKLGTYRAFTVGPMCTVNLVSAEPPSHLGCALFSVEGCPFLSRPNSRRREEGMPEDSRSPAGVSIQRNPGVTCVWVTKGFSIKRVPRVGENGETTGEGIMFGLGAPHDVKWFHSGRPATRDEVMGAIDSGVPALQKYADGWRAERALENCIKIAKRRVPA